MTQQLDYIPETDNDILQRLQYRVFPALEVDSGFQYVKRSRLLLSVFWTHHKLHSLPNKATSLQDAGSRQSGHTQFISLKIHSRTHDKTVKWPENGRL